MEFSQEFLQNRFFQQSLLTVDHWSRSALGPLPEDIGVRYRTDGSVALCVSAPQAKSVTVLMATGIGRVRPVSMVKGGDGAFRGVLDYDPGFTGPANVMVSYDENFVLEPYFPIAWTLNRPFNIIEIPDPEDSYLLIRDVPHGSLSSTMFYADATENWERCMIYTPPGYMNGTEDYPVLYLLNGGTDNETSWDNVGRISNIFDNLIAEGKAVPFVAVMTNTMLRRNGAVDVVRDDVYERLLLESCIPFVEQNFRVRTDKWSRAIAGLSMGAYMTCDISFGHPELFGYVGTFTASMQQTEEQAAQQYAPNGVIRPYFEVLKAVSPEAFAQRYKVYFRSTTPQEDHPELFEADDRLLAEAGYDRLPTYHRIVYPERTSKWNSWRMGVRDFAQLIFKD